MKLHRQIYEIAEQIVLLQKTTAFYKTPSHLNRTGTDGSRLILPDGGEAELDVLSA